MSSLHQHAKDLFIEALARPASERSAFLADACGTDVALRAEVESLLAFHSDPGVTDLTVDTPLTGASWSDAPFAAGDVFAGRYRMIARIGRGGMGDVWRAHDLVLETPVALKLLHLDGPEARTRIANEVRMARQITHPAICRVFDVGEDNGQVFFSMELVQGEDLATLLRRVGRLPSERVMEIGRQLCEGLAAAHAQNVLHRDLKPANVLIDDRGRVLVTDFGIAIPRSDSKRHTMIGTPAYMAPEQLVDGAVLSEQTDLYALGILLYELVVGEHPYAQGQGLGHAKRPSSRVPDVSSRLERVIMQAIAIEPGRRPVSAATMAASLDDTAPVAPARSWRWLAATAAIAALVGGLLVVASLRVPGVGGLTAQDTIVLADFTNTTGEPVFDGTLKVALAVALEQSPFLRVFSDDRVRETLRLMGRAPDDPITRGIAREIAQRQELKALLGGTIAKLGRNYVIALEATNARTGDAMARQQVEVSSKEEVLNGLGKAVADMRQTLGESLASIEKFDTPLPRATTSSLDALHAYSLALDHGVANPRIEAIPHLKRAIELDPNFALALAFLATVYSNTGQTQLAPELAAKAFALRDRVSERERYFIAFRYYRDATQEWDRALDLTRSWTAAYPREAFAFNSLGLSLLRYGRYEASIEPLRQSIQLDPAFSPPYSNLATALVALDRRSEAGEVLQQAIERRAEASGTRRMAYTLSFLADNRSWMQQQLTSWATIKDPTVPGWQGHISAYRGRIAEGHQHFRDGVAQGVAGGVPEVAAQISVEDAEMHAIAGQCDVALREVADGVALSRDNFTLERASRVAALCRAEALQHQLTDELRRRYPLASFTIGGVLPLTSAIAAMTRKEPAEALQQLQAMQGFEQAPRAEVWPAYVRGVAYLQMKDAAQAAEQFRAVVGHRGVDPDSQLHALAYVGLGRALVMSRDTVGARAAYDTGLAVWAEADATLPELIAAQRERAALQ